MIVLRFARDRRQEIEADSPRSNIGWWVVVTILPLLLIAAAGIGYLGWTVSDVDVPISGYVAMALGVIFSLVVGVGLMALVFYSSRAGYDKPAELIQDSGAAKEEVERHPEHEH